MPAHCHYLLLSYWGCFYISPRLPAGDRAPQVSTVLLQGARATSALLEAHRLSLWTWVTFTEVMLSSPLITQQNTLGEKNKLNPDPKTPATLSCKLINLSTIFRKSVS